MRESLWAVAVIAWSLPSLRVMVSYAGFFRRCARHLPGSNVEAVPDVDQGDLDDQGCKRRLVVVPGGLVPDVVRYRVRPITETGGGLGERQSGAFGVIDPDTEVLLADSVGLALLVVLDTLAPAERLAFVLHDMFDLPFDESLRSWGALRLLQGNSRAAHAAGCRELTRFATQISPTSEKLSTPFLLPRVAVTSTHCSRCPTQTSCCELIARPCLRAHRRRSAVLP
jgi:hypothetical protein